MKHEAIAGKMTKRQIGIVGLILLIIAIAVWVVLPRHRGLSGSVASVPVTEIPVHASEVPGAFAAVKSVETPHVWTRPPAKVAVRNSRRANFSLLRQFGAGEKLIDRLTDGDALAVIKELKQQAQSGDPSAANILAFMARFNCAFARITGEGSEYKARELLDAQALSARDAEWIRTAIQEKSASDLQLTAACEAIDKREVEGWVAKAADQGNAASLYLRWRFGNTSFAFKQEKLQAAVDSGFPEAQAWMAQNLTNTVADLPPRQAAGADNLFKAAAESLPYAESLLAVCEFTGCPGIASDIPAAVAHAREAAQRGNFDAMNQIGPQLQASQIDPAEVAAWSLVGAILAQQGCSYGAPTVRWIQASASTLTSKSISDKAKNLAEQYWRNYGTQMMSDIGCAQ
jgi:hypothetical protein